MSIIECIWICGHPVFGSSQQIARLCEQSHCQCGASSVTLSILVGRTGEQIVLI